MTTSPQRTHILSNPMAQWITALLVIVIVWNAENSISNQLRRQLTPSEIPSGTPSTANPETLKEMQALLTIPTEAASANTGTALANDTPSPGDSIQQPQQSGPLASSQTPPAANSTALPGSPQAPQTAPASPAQSPSPDSIRKIVTVDALFPKSRAAVINRQYRQVGDTLTNLTYGSSEAPSQAKLIEVTPTHIVVEDIRTHERTRID